MIRKIAKSVVVILFLVTAFYNGLVTRAYEIESSKITSQLRIVLITDLHNSMHGEAQSKIISNIEAQNPDVIFLVGDIVDSISKVGASEQFFEGIKDIAPIYFVTGNHEYRSGEVETIQKIVKSYGITVLSGEYENVTLGDNNIIIAGIDDPDKAFYYRHYGGYYNQQKTMNSAFSHLESDSTYKILLAHRPENIELYKEYNFDLVVSGHAHGGQIRIPLILNGLFAPHQGFFPKYAGGLYEHDNFVHVVSRGVSFNPKLPRVFNPPEVNVIILNPGD